jgi:DNA modification methylase
VAQQNGWEFLDDIVWIKPEGSAANRNGVFNVHRQPLTYKPNIITEYLFVYRKTTDRLIDWNLKNYPPPVIEESLVNYEYERTNCWYIPPVTDKVHPATFPPELAQRVIGYYSMAGDTVFDPFGGIGTTGQVAYAMDRKYLMFEKDDRYFSEASKRLHYQKSQGRLF